MKSRYSLGLFLVACVLAACGGGGGGGGTIPPGGGGGPTPVPTAAPLAGAAGDVTTASPVSATEAIAYDDEHQTLWIAQGRSISSPNALTTFTLPSSDGNAYIAAASYSPQAHALYFASTTTIYRAQLGGSVTTVASGFGAIASIVVDPSGNVYAVDGDHVSVVANGLPRALTPAGTIVTSAPGITVGNPQLAFDSHDGALYVTDPFGTAVKRVTPAGAVTTVAGSCIGYTGGGQQSCYQAMQAGTGAGARFGAPSGLAYDASADLFYVSDGFDNVIWTMTPSGTTSIAAGYGARGATSGNGRHALLLAPVTLALAAKGLLYFDQLDIFSATSTIGTYVTRGAAAPASTFPALELGTPSIPSQPQALALAPDGSAWITEGYGGGKLAHATTTGITEFPVPAGYHSPYKVTVDAAGAAWATAYSSFLTPGVVRVAADGTSSGFGFPASIGVPEIDGIATGSDGNPWFGWYAFSNAAVASIKTIDRTTGVATDHPIGNSRVRALGAGPDGNIWFTTFPGTVMLLNRMAPDGHLVGSPFSLTRSPIALAPNPTDNSEWFVDGAITLGRVDPNGTETDTLLCSACNAQPGPDALAAAPDGTVWFGETNPGSLAHRDASGHVTRYLLPGPNLGPSGIAVRPDGKVWVATLFGGVYLFDAAAYEAFGLPHPLGNQSVRRSPSSIDKRALFGSVRDAVRQPFGKQAGQREPWR